MAVPPHRAAHWKAAAPPPLPNTTTFSAQSSLPRLPVPALADTLGRLKKSLAPIAWNDAEYAAVVSKIDAFAEQEGPELHSRLLQRAQSTPHWLEEWWDDAGYLAYRDSVVVNVSYFYGFDAPPHLPETPAYRAAGIARSAMLFRQKLKRGLLTPEGTKEGPICVDTYRWMFDCCRVPGRNGKDFSISYAKEGDQGDSGHIIVIRKNRIWKVQAAENGRILSTQELEQQIQHIYDNSNSPHEYPGVGVLAASNRDVWAKDYAELASSSHNRSILAAIHSSAFIVSLDTSTPVEPIHHSRALWHGDLINGIPVGLRNRWVDKPLQFIIFDNASAGFMGEHSIMDGTPTARMCDVVLDTLYSPSFDHGSGSFDVIPAPLDWEISKTVTAAITKANEAARELIESQELTYLLTSYGKDAIKSFGVSPDSWAQMIIQLAYKRLLTGKKRYGGTYEAASTRRFYKGRTEAIRVVTSDSDAWVNSMNTLSTTQEERKNLFDAATRTHVSLAKSAGQGQGVDRHLFGLKKLLKAEESIPELFTDPVLIRSSHWVLSTSAIFSKHFPVYGWGEVVPDGFGVAYMTGYDDHLQFTITSRVEMPNAQFVKEIARAAEDVYHLHALVNSKL